MTNYNELIGRHLVKVILLKGANPEIITAVDGIIEEVDATTLRKTAFFRINGSWAACATREDVKEALTEEGREYNFDEGYSFFKIY